jgi:uncharacterized membrane protein
MTASMTIEQFLAELRHAIRSLPPDEIDQAIDYYDGYLRDAADPAVAMAQLGTPKEVAAQVLAGYVGKRGTSPGMRVLWAVVIGVLAVPVAAPLTIGVFAVLAALVIALVAVLFALFAATIALLLGGLATIITGVLVIGQSFGAFAWASGTGLVCCAVGLLGIYGMVRLGHITIAGLARWAGSIINHITRGRQS